MCESTRHVAQAITSWHSLQLSTLHETLCYLYLLLYHYSAHAADMSKITSIRLTDNENKSERSLISVKVLQVWRRPDVTPNIEPGINPTSTQQIVLLLTEVGPTTNQPAITTRKKLSTYTTAIHILLKCKPMSISAHDALQVVNDKCWDYWYFQSLEVYIIHYSEEFKFTIL